MTRFADLLFATVIFAGKRAPEIIYVNPGENITLQCSASASDSVRWIYFRYIRKDGMDILETRFSRDIVGVEIKNFSPLKHQATYVCEVLDMNKQSFSVETTLKVKTGILYLIYC